MRQGLAGKSVDVRRCRQPVPVKGHIFRIQGVERDQQEVGFGRRGASAAFTVGADLARANSVATSAAVPATVAIAVRRVIFSPTKRWRLVTIPFRAREMKRAATKAR